MSCTQLGLLQWVHSQAGADRQTPRHFTPQVRELTNPGAVYQKLMDFMERLARLGLIHCDFNEFNVMVGGFERAERACRRKPPSSLC